MDPIKNPFSPGAGAPPPELVGKDSILKEAAEDRESAIAIFIIAAILNFKMTSLAPVRAKLIKKGMINSPVHGELAFTVPLFDEFLMRAITNL